MILDLSSVFAVVVLGTPILLFIMFLPTVLELKKPRDAGPRLIMGDILGVATQVVQVPLIMNIEEDHEYNAVLIPAIGSILSFLPKLEA
jgi:hypothetical protein